MNDERTRDKRTGRVRWFNDAKGYGFIDDSETGEGYFVNFKHILDPEALDGRFRLIQGDTVEFVIADDPKNRKMAGEVRTIQRATSDELLSSTMVFFEDMSAPKDRQ